MQTRTAARTINLWEGEPAIFVARVTTAGGTPVVSSNVSYVEVKVFDMQASAQGTEVYADSPIDPTTVYFDTLQTDDYSNLLGDSLGYNFRYILDADTFAFGGGKRYRVQIASAIGGSSHMQVYDLAVGEVL